VTTATLMSSEHVDSEHHGKATLLEAARALVTVVRSEYGDRWTLAYIAGTWGEGVTPGQLEAVAYMEALLSEPDAELLHEGREGVDVDGSDSGD
jgi:hypothetical protein